MRVLWFPGNGALYSTDNKYNGGGWTGALLRALRNKNDGIVFGIAIPWDAYMVDEVEGIKVYGIPPIKHGFFNYQNKLTNQIHIMGNIVNDFNPDIIHVFGSEHTGGMVSTIAKVPVVLHLQGIMNFLKEAWLPQNMSWGKYIFWHPGQWIYRKSITRSCKIERTIFGTCRHYMGRTNLDKRVLNILSPESSYYYCSEMLRPEIYFTTKTWTFHKRDHHCIISVISSPLYKGGDILLRTAEILKNRIGVGFEWHVYGVTDLSDCERLTAINSKDVNVFCCGIISAKEIVEKVIEADVFVHPSYIENSPNTVCEAQIIGIPVIANYVGGVPSIITHLDTGVLVPASDPYITASYVAELVNDEILANKLGKAGREAALLRHNPDTIVNRVINIYKEVLNDSDKK